MIPQTIPAWHTLDWKEQLKNAVTDVDLLLGLVGLESAEFAGSTCRDQQFQLRVPLSFVERMEYGNPNDPLLLQVLPVLRENEAVEGFSEDPLAERQYNPVPGIVHKYENRVLLITSGGCAVNCRYCFRRHFPYSDNNPGKDEWQNSLAYIRTNPAITEVILSGGDPLSASDKHLHWLVQQLDTIPHLRRLRIHTRLPVMIPERLDDNCLAWVGSSRLKTTMVLHVNHANELSSTITNAVSRLKALDITVLNQTVLLKGINDNVDTLTTLQESLFDTGILPYYLHLLDPVSGASHFQVVTDQAISIYKALQAKLPGYLVPRLVRDLPGRPSKTLVLS